MEVKIETWNDDLVVRIPPNIAEQVHLAVDAVVELSIDDGAIILQPQGYKRKKFSLEELVAGITDENRHEVIDWGPPVGREVW